LLPVHRYLARADPRRDAAMAAQAPSRITTSPSAGHGTVDARLIVAGSAPYDP
jgi:hypothetical protein